MLDIEKIRKEKPVSELLRFSIINLDKPIGTTSFSVTNYVKNLLNINKTSHFGTLDPMVSGVLPVALGRACRLNEYFMHRDKEYVGIMHLHSEISETKLKEEINNFIGMIKQIPPLKSRVKRVERIREVKTFEIIEIEGKDILFKTKVQAGTYIRKLVHDLGEKIGGAHMLELRRIKAGIFDETNLITLYDLEKAIEELNKGNENIIRNILTPAEIITKVLPVLEIKKEYEKQCLTGSPIFIKFVKKPISTEKGDKVCAVICDRFIGCYRVEKNGELFAIPEFVFN